MILVTGGTGFVGRLLVRSLARSGRGVRILSRHPIDPHDAPEPGVDWLRGDLCQPDSRARALSGVTAVVHLGALLDGPDSQLWKVNVEATRALALAARHSGVRSFIHVSSAGVYGDRATCLPYREHDACNPSTPYERSKLASESAVLEALGGSSASWVILRPTGVYGSERRTTRAFLGEVARRRLWLHASPRLWLNPLYVHDLVAAIELALVQHCTGEIFNVGGERVLTYPSWIAANARALGARSIQIAAPAGASAAVARTLSGTLRLAHLPVTPRLHRATQAVCSRVVDISAICATWGFRATALESSLETMIAELRASSSYRSPA
jgi:nucleoside-diphosphate-sugar epimerase